MTTRNYNITFDLTTFETSTTSIEARSEHEAIDQFLESIQSSLSLNQEVSIRECTPETTSSGYTSLASLYNVTPPSVNTSEDSANNPPTPGYTRLIN